MKMLKVLFMVVFFALALLAVRLASPDHSVNGAYLDPNPIRLNEKQMTKMLRTSSLLSHGEKRPFNKFKKSEM